MTPEQAIGAALAAVDRLRDYGMRPRRRNRDQAFGAIAIAQLRDAGYEVVTRRELEQLRQVDLERRVERIHRVAPPRQEHEVPHRPDCSFASQHGSRRSPAGCWRCDELDEREAAREGAKT